MSVLSRMISTLRTLVHPHDSQDDAAEEMRFHAEQHATDLQSKGVLPAEAQRQARAALGMHARNGGERHREIVGLRLFDEVRADVRYGLRGLWRNKSFALIAILSMALGIGAATAMFSVVYAVLLDIYPYADANRTVNPIVHDPNVPDDWTWFVLNKTQYEVYRKAQPFQDVFGMTTFNVQTDEDNIQQPLKIVLLTANAQTFNRVPAFLGRTLQSSDGDLGQQPTNVAVLSFKYWQTHYAAEKAVLGRTIKVNRQIYRIVGVMPQRFTLGQPDMYMPLSQTQELVPKSDPVLIAFAKLKPGLTAA